LVRYQHVSEQWGAVSAFGVWLFGRTVSEGGLRLSCAGCGCTVSFFIKPANGLQLPEIMKWIKQTCGYIWMMEDRGTSGVWVGDPGRGAA
jgi:hypothetical protein